MNQPSSGALRVIVDCDPGIDDGLALALLAAHHRAGRLTVEAVVAVGGNVGLDRTSANARFVLDRCRLDAVPVLRGAAAPLSLRPGRTDAGAPGDGVHGGDGLCGLYEDGHRPAEHPSGGVEEVLRLLRAGRREGRRAGRRESRQEGRRDEWCLLALGPLTDLALALALEPDLATLVDRVVVMGGAFGEPPDRATGNVTPWAEFNFWADPQAAAQVCASSLPLELVPLDVTRRVTVTGADARGLPAGLPTRLLGALAQVDGGAVHDPLAAAVLVDPSLVLTRRLGLLVVADGPAAGHVAWHPGGARTTGVAAPSQAAVALDVDVERARQAILAPLGGADSGRGE